MIPFIVNYYPQSIDELLFYTEIYQTDKIFGQGEKFLISYYIESFETNRYLSNLIKTKKEESKPVNVLFTKFIISDLPSGNYNLVVEIRDQKNTLVAENKLFFQRSNPDVKLEMKDISTLDVENTFAGQITNIDTLKDYIKTLVPISSDVEKLYAKNLSGKSEIKPLQQYFLNFWLNRDSNDPEKAWKEYLVEVRKADENFSTSIRRGYETDRGRVYLKYGPPNVISDNPHEPSAYPYQIWQYYQLDHQRNKKFVFISKDLVTNDYELIHSDAIGEFYNNSWKLMVHRRDTPTNDPDETEFINHFGSRLNEFFDNPR
ncbi:GWxTD domain-containing protein [Bacteroidota bacterium]